METPKVPAAPAAAAEMEQERRLLQEAEGYYADDEELFEIDLEVLNRIPPRSNHVFELDLEVFDRVRPAAKDCQQTALLANCILPVTYICNAVPIDAAGAAAAATAGRVERKTGGWLQPAELCLQGGAGCVESRKECLLLEELDPLAD